MPKNSKKCVSSKSQKPRSKSLKAGKILGWKLKRPYPYQPGVSSTRISQRSTHLSWRDDHCWPRVLPVHHGALHLCWWIDKSWDLFEGQGLDWGADRPIWLREHRINPYSSSISQDQIYGEFDACLLFERHWQTSAARGAMDHHTTGRQDSGPTGCLLYQRIVMDEMSKTERRVKCLWTIRNTDVFK